MQREACVMDIEMKEKGSKKEFNLGVDKHELINQWL